MTDRRGDQGFEVAPLQLDGGAGSHRSRRGQFGLALVVAAAAGIIAAAWLGPRLSARPNLDAAFFATPIPSPSPSPSASATVPPFGSFLATPLPAITRPDGPVPSGRVAVVTDAIRVLDLTTGDVVSGPQTQLGRDAVVRAPTGTGWTCICFVDDAGSDKPNLIIRIARSDATGASGDLADIATLPNPPDVSGQPALTTDVDTFAGNRRGLLALAARNGDTWRFTVSPLDIEAGLLGPPVELGKNAAPVALPSAAVSAAPSPIGPVDTYIDGPHIRISPDGRVAFVWAMLQRSDPEGNAVSAMHAWRLALGPDGSVRAVAEAPGLLRMPVYCGAVGFAAADRFVWLCPDISDPNTGEYGGQWVLGTIDLDGRPAGTTRLSIATDRYFSAPLFDRANGEVYAWDPVGLTIARIDVHSLTVAQTTFDPLAESANGLPEGGGFLPVVWHDADSAVKMNQYGAMAADPAGDRLYAVGWAFEPVSDSGLQPSRGVFVIDRATLALVDRWAPAANYISLAMLPGGLVAAMGTPGVQADGHDAPWEASLTVHDSADGRILVRFGQLGSSSPPFVVDR